MSRSILAVCCAMFGLTVLAHGQDPRTDGVDFGGTSAPTVVKRADPVYPTRAMRGRLAGVVHVKAKVLRDGSIRDVRVSRSCLGPLPKPVPQRMPGFPCVNAPTTPTPPDADASLGLNDAAIEAVRKWVFTPARKHGEPLPVEADIEVIVQFILRVFD